MSQILTNYQRLSTDLKLAKDTERELETLLKSLPAYCPMRKIVRRELDQARQIKRDIMNDINLFADSIDFKLKWRKAV